MPKVRGAARRGRSSGGGRSGGGGRSSGGTGSSSHSSNPNPCSTETTSVSRRYLPAQFTELFLRVRIAVFLGGIRGRIVEIPTKEGIRSPVSTSHDASSSLFIFAATTRFPYLHKIGSGE
ncbi:unnamed protein product [Arabidopsis arenosa]|uniref:Uncharacterized protein n=1 Tax=Arabidopsis arenosa TaxID=38785 RepID=A0A8S2A160_ARAAE|nr:unnamed protein product [Arabidopsis arenosa]